MRWRTGLGCILACVLCGGLVAAALLLPPVAARHWDDSYLGTVHATEAAEPEAFIYEPTYADQILAFTRLMDRFFEIPYWYEESALREGQQEYPEVASMALQELGRWMEAGLLPVGLDIRLYEEILDAFTYNIYPLAAIDYDRETPYPMSVYVLELVAQDKGVLLLRVVLDLDTGCIYGLEFADPVSVQAVLDQVGIGLDWRDLLWQAEPWTMAEGYAQLYGLGPITGRDQEASDYGDTYSGTSYVLEGQVGIRVEYVADALLQLSVLPGPARQEALPTVEPDVTPIPEEAAYGE